MKDWKKKLKADAADTARGKGQDAPKPTKKLGGNRQPIARTGKGYNRGART